MKYFFLIVTVALLATSCKKNEAGGSSKVYGTVAHHGVAIPYSRVFIKYGAKEFPGTDTSLYDAKFSTDATASYTFELYQGDYFLYGYGYDNTVPGIVTGGVPYKLRKNESKKLEVPVTEQ